MSETRSVVEVVKGNLEWVCAKALGLVLSTPLALQLAVKVLRRSVDDYAATRCFLQQVRLSLACLVAMTSRSPTNPHSSGGPGL